MGKGKISPENNKGKSGRPTVVCPAQFIFHSQMPQIVTYVEANVVRASLVAQHRNFLKKQRRNVQVLVFGSLFMYH